MAPDYAREQNNPASSLTCKGLIDDAQFIPGAGEQVAAEGMNRASSMRPLQQWSVAGLFR